MATSGSSFDGYRRIVGLLIILRAVAFFVVEIPMMHSYAEMGKINAYSVAFFFSFLYFAYSMIFGLKLCGVFLGSNRERFAQKLESLKPPSLSESIKNRGTDEVDVEKLKSAYARPTFPTPEPLSPRTVFIFLFVDLVAVLVLQILIPDLPRFYVIAIFEFVILALSVREIIRTRKNSP